MSESGSRWEPGQVAEGPFETDATRPPQGPPVETAAARPPQGTQSGRRRLPTRTGVLLTAAGMALFLAGGTGGYALATARHASTGLVPAGFRIGDHRGFGDGDGGRLPGQNPFGQSNPFGSQGTTT